MSLPVSPMESIGYAAATLTTVSFLPQLLRVLKLRSARDISLEMFLIFTAGTCLWLVYGILMHSAPMTVANAVTSLLAAWILILKLRFDRGAVRPDLSPGVARQKVQP